VIFEFSLAVRFIFIELTLIIMTFLGRYYELSFTLLNPIHIVAFVNHLILTWKVPSESTFAMFLLFNKISFISSAFIEPNQGSLSMNNIIMKVTSVLHSIRPIKICIFTFS
jgi:hypothetical protein